MRTASVRDLRYNFRSIERLLARGEEIRITKRGKVIARMTPSVREPANIPDFRGRMQDIFGNRKLTPSGAQLIVQERNRY